MRPDSFISLEPKLAELKPSSSVVPKAWPVRVKYQGSGMRIDSSAPGPRRCSADKKRVWDSGGFTKFQT